LKKTKINTIPEIKILNAATSLAVNSSLPLVSNIDFFIKIKELPQIRASEISNIQLLVLEFIAMI
jgi:hypothetical protein